RDRQHEAQADQRGEDAPTSIDGTLMAARRPGAGLTIGLDGPQALGLDGPQALGLDGPQALGLDGPQAPDGSDRVIEPGLELEDSGHVLCS
ncbi:MAG: hypothetical protein M3Q30_24595, partial [Actinomycetota bacterium]|nr:hypothetical protein [Actinomycetota bacterium]